MIKQKMENDDVFKKDDALGLDPEIVPLTAISHPPRVRRRKVELLQTVHPGESITVRGSFARVSTVGQTFSDMIETPSLCGGMIHVLDVWRTYAKTYLHEIIPAIEVHTSSIVKVRAGYILEELLSVTEPRIAAWSRFAQRGGSRLLDPSKPYAPTYSEKWMISINV
jgi:predicted transcriptional regulator of viral defense system